MGGLTGIPNDPDSIRSHAMGVGPIQVLNIDPPKPPPKQTGPQRFDPRSGPMFGLSPERKYEMQLREYEAKQRAAATQYNKLWDSDPTKYVQTLDKDLASGTITQEYYDSQFKSGQKRTHRDTYYKQQEAKAKRERELAEQQAALRESQEKARKAAQQQRTLQGLESVDETSGEVVAVSGGGASETEEARGRRRRGGMRAGGLGIEEK